MTDEGAADLAQRRHVALASPVRQQILALLRDAGGATDAAEIGRRTGIHVTTARFHLEQLESAELVVRDVAHGTSRGRPRMTYAAARGQSPLEPLRALSGVLADAISHDADGGTARARAAGRKWAESFGLGAGLDRDSPVRALAKAFDELGFEPELAEPADSGGGPSLVLHGCPFRDTARAYPRVVCAAHAGLISGLLDQLDSDDAGAALVPFVEPEVCLVRFGPTGP